jgi:flagellar protein FliJ
MQGKKKATSMRQCPFVSRNSHLLAEGIFQPASLELVVMKSRDTLVRLKRFQVEEKRRRLTQIEMMIAEFNRMAGELDREIASEEQKSGVTDLSHYAYPTYARAARTRRDNLLHSADELKGQLEEARVLFEQANEELTKAQVLEGRDKPSVLGEMSRDVAEFGALRGARA